MMQKKYFKLITMCVITISLSSCLTSFVANPVDVNKVSKQLSKSEKAAHVRKVVPQTSKEVYKTVKKYLNSKTGEAVVRYSYNKIIKQYQNYDWVFMFFPPNKEKGAYIASKQSLLAGPSIKKLKLTMVYVTPQQNGGTEIKVVRQNPSSARNKANTLSVSQKEATDVLNEIINRLPTLDQSPPAVQPVAEEVPEEEVTEEEITEEETPADDTTEETTEDEAATTDAAEPAPDTATEEAAPAPESETSTE